MGRRIAEQLIDSAKEILDAGVSDPEIFELSGLFEEGVVPDRISDMISGLLADRLAAFTVRICRTLSIPCKSTYTTKKQSYKVPREPRNKKPLLDGSSGRAPRPTDRPRRFRTIGQVCVHNQAVREELNSLIGTGWKIREVHKSTISKRAFRHPDALEDLIKRYKASSKPSYDFETDPASRIRWAWIEDRKSRASQAREAPQTITRSRAPDSTKDLRALC